MGKRNKAKVQTKIQIRAGKRAKNARGTVQRGVRTHATYDPNTSETDRVAEEEAGTGERRRGKC